MNPSAQNFKAGSARPDSRGLGPPRQGRGEGYNTRADDSLYTGGVKVEPQSPRPTHSQVGYGNPTPVRSGHLTDYWQPQASHSDSNLGSSRDATRGLNELPNQSSSSRLTMGEGSRFSTQDRLSTQDAFDYGAFRGQLPNSAQHHGPHELASGNILDYIGGPSFDDEDEDASSNTYGSTSFTNTRRAPRGRGHPANKPSVKYMTCWYWKSRGHCIHSDESCLYSHQDTGVYADRPKKIDPSLPSVAGRNAIELENIFTEQLKKLSRNESMEDQTETGFAAANRIVLLEETVKTLGIKLEETAQLHIQWGQQARREHMLMNALSQAAKRGDVTDKDLEQIGAKMEARLRDGEEILNGSAGDIVNVSNAVKRQLNVGSYQDLPRRS